MISPLSSNRYSNAVYSLQSNYSQQTSSVSSSESGRTGNDTVTISKQGKKASLSGSMSTILEKIPSSPEELRQCISDDTKCVEDKLRSIYSKLGLSSDDELKISVGRDGKIIVKGDSSKAEEVADAINSDPELSNTIRRMSANTSLLDAIKKHEEFAKAYEADPEQAVKDFSWLFDDNRQSSVTFSLSNGNMSSEINHFHT